MFLVWLVDWLLVGGLLVLLGNWPPAAAGLVALAVLAGLTLGAASGACEHLVAWFQGARRPTREEEAQVAAAVAAVGRSLGDRWRPDVRVVDRPLPLAWAVGRHTVVVTVGLLSFCDGAEIAGVLAHEAGHQLSGHARRRLILRVLGLSGTLAGVCSWSVLQLGLGLRSRRSPAQEAAGGLLAILGGALRLLILAAGTFQAAGLRREEYAADAFAVRLGVGGGLSSYLGRLAWLDQESGWRRLTLPHPCVADRLARLRSMM